MSALMCASVVSNTETVQVLVQHGAGLDITDVSTYVISVCFFCWSKDQFSWKDNLQQFCSLIYSELYWPCMTMQGYGSSMVDQLIIISSCKLTEARSSMSTMTATSPVIVQAQLVRT